jgi:glucosamine--fructose-6-phosphate aminotransferase (isomerizing)
MRINSMDSLQIQSQHAIEFITSAWPEAQEAARQALKAKESKFEEVILFGCGDSHHAALGLEMAFDIWTGLKARAATAMTASRYLVPRLKVGSSQTLLIGISASGEVARTLEAVEMGVSCGARTLALTGAADSSLARASHMSLSVPVPSLPEGPGLLSFLSSLLMGLAVVQALAGEEDGKELDACMRAFPASLEAWIQEQSKVGRSFAEEIDPASAVVFLGCGPAYGMAKFAAAKLIEAAGMPAWGQDGEEWTHIEYFAEPAEAPTWLFTTRGRSHGREEEIIAAAHAIGRNLKISRWEGRPEWSSRAREALSPLALWPGPVAFASRMAARLGEEPFRDFGGGRSTQEGGGASRIRSSTRLRNPNELER